MEATNQAGAITLPVGAGYPACTQSFLPLARATQGRATQGRATQGRATQGTGTDGWSTVAIRFGCNYVENLQLNGTVFSGTLNGAAVSGNDFIGATVIEQDLNGTYSDSTISNIENDPKDASGATKLYTLTYVDDQGVTQNTCQADADGVSKAIPLTGTWDATAAHVASNTSFTFGCTKGVIAKCVRWGYKPWQSVNGTSLADYHQACTRMARADYCGDGVTHTQDGTLIDMYDDQGIQKKSGALTLPLLIFDAAWSTDGAYCMTKDRWLVVSQLLSFTLDCKTKFLNLFPLVETSPVDAADLCAVKRADVSRSQAHIDNKSGINLQLF